jgi:hypothetical protein
MQSEANAKWRAVVPFVVVVACDTPIYEAKADSNLSIYAPEEEIHPVLIQSDT